MKEIELFKASMKENVVISLGVEVAGEVEDLRIIINGVDITENVKLDEVKIILKRKNE